MVSVKLRYLLFTNAIFLTREFTDELLQTFLEQRVLNILSLVFRLFLLESQTTSVPRAELQRPQQEKGKKGRVFFI